MRFAYFHAKSRTRHSAGKATRLMSQYRALLNSTGSTPKYSRLKPNFGATVA